MRRKTSELEARVAGPVRRLEPAKLLIAALLLGTPRTGLSEEAAAIAEPPMAEPETIEIVDTLVDPARIAGSAQTITELELEKFEHDDVNRVLRQVPGIYLREEDGFGLRPNIGLRGASSDRSSKITLMEDGILFAPAPYSAPAAYYFPLMSDLGGVEVYKGPAAIRFGPNTVGGALNLLTRPIPSVSRGMIDLTLGQYRSGKVHAGWGGSSTHAGILIEGTHLQSEGFKELDGGGNTGFDKNELRVKARLHTDMASRLFQQLELKLGYADERSNETYLGLSDADFAETPYRRYAASQRDHMSWWRTQVQLGHFLRFGEHLDLRTTVYRHDFSRSWTKLNRFQDGPSLIDILAHPDSGQSSVYAAILEGTQDSETPDQALMIGTNARAFVSQGVQMVGHWRTDGLVFYQNLELGLRLHHDQIERHHTEDGFLMIGGALVSDGNETLLTADTLGSSRALALHLHDELSYKRWMLTPGVRLERIGTRFDDHSAGTQVENRDTVVLPGLGLLFRAAPVLDVFAGVHRGFSPASPGQADEVRPELSFNYEAGTRLSLETTRAELIGFFNDYSNLTGECTLSTGCTEERLNEQFNAGRVHVWGLEAVAGQSFTGPLGLELSGNASYTLTRSRFLTSFESEDPQLGEVTVGDALPFVPVHQGALILGVVGTRWSVDVSAVHMGSVREKAGQGEIPDGERIESFTVVDLAGHLKTSPRGELYLKVDNLFDAEYLVSRQPYGARPGKPFWFQLGYRHRFGATD